MTEPTLDHLRALAERCKARDSDALQEYPEVAKLLLESFTGEESERQRLWQAIVDLNSDIMERGALNLLPCPFCGTSRETIIGGVAGLNLAGLDDGFWVECLGCGASAQQRATQVEAIAAWNRRHPGGATRCLICDEPLVDPDAPTLARQPCHGWGACGMGVAGTMSCGPCKARKRLGLPAAFSRETFAEAAERFRAGMDGAE